MVTYVREHPTQVFLPQPQQLDLEITDSSLTTMLHVTPVCFKLLRNTDPPPSKQLAWTCKGLILDAAIHGFVSSNTFIPSNIF